MAKVTASGRIIVRTTPYSMGCVDVPLGRARPLRSASAHAALPDARPGIAMRSTMTCLVAYCTRPRSATIPAPITRRRTTARCRASVGMPSLATSRIPASPTSLSIPLSAGLISSPEIGHRHRMCVHGEHDQQPHKHRRPYRLRTLEDVVRTVHFEPEPETEAAHRPEGRRGARTTQSGNNHRRRDAEEQDDVHRQDTCSVNPGRWALHRRCLAQADHQPGSAQSAV